MAGVCVGIGLGLWVTAGAWGSRPPAGDDVMALLIRADFGLSELAGRGKVDGWSPRFITGYEHFLFYGPGFTWLVGLVRVFTLGALSLTGALKVVAVGSYIAMSPAAAFLARSAGLTKRAAGVAAVLVLAVNNPFGIGLSGTFTIALLPHQVAGTAFCLAFGSALRSVTDSRKRWVVLLGCSLAAAVVTHLITTAVLALFLLMALPTVFATERPRLVVGAVARLGIGGAIAAALSAFWLVPYVAHFGERGVVPAWATPAVGTRLSDIFAGRILLGPWLAWVVAAGLVYGGWRVVSSRRWALALLLAPPLFFVVTHTLASRFPGIELSPQLANRGLGYAGLIAVLSLAALLADAAGLLPWRYAGTAVALGVAVMLVVVIPDLDRGVASQMPEPSPVMSDAAAAVRSAVPEGARFATERDWPAEIGRTGVSHPDFWLAWHARRDTLNIFGLELSPSPGAGSEAERIGKKSAEESADALARLGVSHVVTVKPETAPVLEQSGRFRVRWRREFMAVFEVVPSLGQPSPSSLISVPAGSSATASRRTRGAEDMTFTVESHDRVPVTIAVGWSEKWRAEVDGEPTPLRRTADGLLRMNVDGGRHRIVLTFHRDGWNRAGIVISALTVVGGTTCLLLAWARRRLRRV